jgi:hypothetical protein
MSPSGCRVTFRMRLLHRDGVVGDGERNKQSSIGSQRIEPYRARMRSAGIDQDRIAGARILFTTVTPRKLRHAADN